MRSARELCAIAISLMLLAFAFGVTTSTQAASGTWSVTTAGNWSTAANWAGSTIADGIGVTADISTKNITTGRIITLDSARTVGTLKLADATTVSSSWTISGANILTFDVASGTPEINVLDAGSGAGHVISSVLAGTKGLAKTGTGWLSLGGANSFTGGLTIKAGTVTVGVANALGDSGTGAVTLGDSSGSANVTLVAGNFTQANPITVAAGSSGNTIGITTVGAQSPVFSGNITLNNTVTPLTLNPGATTGQLNLNGVISGPGALVCAVTYAANLAGANTFSGGVTLNGPGALRLNNGGSGGTSSALGTGTLTINGGALGNNGAADVIISTPNLQVWNGDFTYTSAARNLTFGNGPITLGGSRIVTVADHTLTVPGAIGDGGSGYSLTKAGAGTLILSGANTYTGITTVSNGILGGSGKIKGPMTVASGGTLRPGLGGTDTSALTISNTLSLAGTTVIALNRTNASNASTLKGISTITFGGALVVTNVGPTMQVGDTFTLFSATNYTGNFSTMSLPDLNLGLDWKVTNGTISVISDFQSYSMAAGTSTLPAGWAFYWNQPNGWIANTSSGDLATGHITNRASWTPLLWSGTQWTADGDNVANNSPANFLRVSATGGIPGVAGADQNLDRYGISAYRVSAPGDYQIGMAWAELTNTNSNGIKIKIFKNGIFQREILAKPGAPKRFETRVEGLAVNDEIAVAVGANGSASFDTYNLDYTIALVTPAFADAQVFDVAAYGAMGDGTNDDLTAVSNAITAAAASPSGGIVRFDGTKTYRIIGGIGGTGSVSTVAFSLSRMRNVLLQGNGATMLLYPPDKLLDIEDCQNIQVDGFVLNYDPLPYFQGIITGADTNNLTVDITVPARYAVPVVDAGYDTNNAGNWVFGRTFVPNSPGSRVGSGTHLYINSVVALDSPTNRNLRIYADPNNSLAAAAVRQAATTATEVVVPARNLGQQGSFALIIQGSSRIRISNLQMQCLPASGILPIGNVGPVTFDNVNMLTPDPTNELFVSWRGGFGVIADNRFGMKVKHCKWHGGAMYDDLFNFSTYLGRVAAVSNTTVDVVATRAGNQQAPWLAGDWIRVSPLAEDLVRGYARIVSTDGRLGTSFSVTLDRAIPGLLTNDVIINEELLCRGSLVQSCTNYPLGSRQGGSGRIRTPTVFDHDDLDGVYFWLATEYSYRNGPAPADIVFSNSRLGYVDQSGPATLDILTGRNVLFSNCTVSNTTVNVYTNNAYLLPVTNSNIFIEDVAWISQAAGTPAMQFQSANPVYIYGNTTVNGSASLASWIDADSRSTICFTTPDPLPTPAIGDYDSDGLADALEDPGDGDGDGLAGRKDSDSDNDGLPDGYEYENGLDPWAAADATLDLDGDGLNNWGEFIAGTSPRNGQERLTMSLSCSLSPDVFAVSVKGVCNRQYVLYRSNNLQNWEAVDAIGPLGLDEDIQLLDCSPPAKTAFYRVTVAFSDGNL